MAVPRVLQRRPTEIFCFDNIITSVPAGATTTVDMQLDEGFYQIRFGGTQTAATTDPTLTFTTFIGINGDKEIPVYGLLGSDGAATLSIDLEIAQTSFTGYLRMGIAVADPSPIYIGSGGLRVVYTKNGGTAIDLSVAAIRVA